MSEHTPGPWTVRRLRMGSGEYDIYSVTGQGWANGHRTVAEVGDWLDRPDGNAQADARLIAAAPKLLAAAEALIAVVHESDGIEGWHLNGAPAPWAEFEFVKDFEDAIAAAKEELQCSP